MPDASLVDPNAGVAKVFTAIVATLKKLRWQQEAPDVFLVYAHDNDIIEKPADAKIARQLIEWLRQIGANIYSDTTGMGNSPIPKATSPDTAIAHDILSSQLGLLPTNHFVQPGDKRQRLILCGSALLGHYTTSDYYQHTYYPGFKEAYQRAQQQTSPADAKKVLSNYVNSHLNNDGFHHVLTELACLELRNQSEPDSHCIVPIALNNRHQAVFPDFISHSTTIRILDIEWQDQKTYQDQGLHEGFFRLLDRLWEHKMHIIQVIAKKVYSNCLKALATQRLSEQALTSVILEAIQDAQQRLIEEGSSALQMLSNQAFLQEIKAVLIAEKPNSLTLDTHEIYEALEKTLGNRLQIKRVSGALLPMNQCYINLAIIEHQVNRARDKDNAMRTQGFDRLSSDEAIPETNIAEHIPLEELFRPRRLNSGKEDIPRRILIRGRAGIGKTTLAKKSMYGYLQQGLWNDQFDWVLWIPLRHLKGDAGHHQLDTVIYEEYFKKGYPEQGRALAQALYRSIQQDPLKTLLILDGWDEISQEEMPAGLVNLLNHPSVIITSRPYGVSLYEIKAWDLELETVGFSEENIMEYLDHPNIVDPAAAKEIKVFIRQYPFVRELANIPIQLDALCYSWDEIQNSQSVTTMTGLYETMITKLWGKDIVQLQRIVDGRPATAATIKTMASYDIKDLMNNECHLIGALALNGLVENQIEFTQHHWQTARRQLQQDGYAIPATIIGSTINQLSCLQVDQSSSLHSLFSYAFLHLTFQEFFAAQWLVDCFIQDKPLSLHKHPTMKAEAFIQQYKYNPQYEIMWRFVSGLWPKEKLPDFFDLLDQGARDLIGVQHQNLIMYSLRETTGKLPTELYALLASGLCDWLTFESTSNRVDVAHIFTPHRTPYSPSEVRISSLGRQDAFPEMLLLAQLGRNDSSVNVRQTIIKTLAERQVVSSECIQSLIPFIKDKKMRLLVEQILKKQSSLPENVIQLLIAHLEDQDRDVRRLAVDMLARQSSLPEHAIQLLIARLDDQDSGVRRLATHALARQFSLPENTIQLLIARLDDQDSGVRRAAAEGLKKQSSLPENSIQLLIAHFDDQDSVVRVVVAQTLAKQSSLPENAIQLLIARLQDQDTRVRRMAADSLEKLSSLPDASIRSLVNLLQSQNSNLRLTALRIVEQQSQLPPDAIDILIACLGDKQQSVRDVAEATLKHQSSLPDESIQNLIIQLDDTNESLRWKAQGVLEHQSLLPKDAIDTLITLFKRQDGDVRWAAVRALGQQSSLPHNAVDALIACLDDREVRVRQSTISNLRQQSVLTREAIQLLIARLKDKVERVHWLTVTNLRQQSVLPSEVIQPLIARLEDEDEKISWETITNSERKSELPKKVIQLLITRLEDKDEKLRSKAVWTLSRQSSLPEEAIKALIARLDGEMSQAAVQALGNQSSLSDEAIKALIARLKDQSGTVRWMAINALVGKRSSKRSLLPPKALLTLLEDQNAFVRYKALKVLVAQRSLLPETLLTLLEHEDASIRQISLKALVEQFSLSDKAIQALISCLGDNEKNVRDEAEAALKQQSLLSDEAVRTLIACLDNQNGCIKWGAEAILVHQSSLPQDAIDTLITLFKHQDGEVRWSAVRVLEKQSRLPDKAIQALIAGLFDMDVRVRESSQSTLGRQSSFPQEVIPLLISHLGDKNSDVRQATVKALWDLSPLPREVLHALIALCKDENNEVRFRTVRLLGKQYPLPQEVIQALVTCFRDEDLNIREVSVWSLEDESFWYLYQAVSNKSIQFNQLYSLYFIPCSFDRISPFYLHDNVVYFYEARQLKHFALDKSTTIQFKQSVLQAQRHAGIPLTSWIKLTTKEINSLPIYTRSKLKFSQFFQSADHDASSSQHTEGKNYLWKSR